MGHYYLREFVKEIGARGLLNDGSGGGFIEQMLVLERLSKAMGDRRNRTRMDFERSRLQFDVNAVFTQEANELRSAAAASVEIAKKHNLREVVADTRAELFGLHSEIRSGALGAREPNIRGASGLDSIGRVINALHDYHRDVDWFDEDEDENDTHSVSAPRRCKKLYVPSCKIRKEKMRPIEERYGTIAEKWQTGPVRLTPLDTPTDWQGDLQEDSGVFVSDHVKANVPAGRARQLRMQTRQLMKCMSEPSPHSNFLTNERRLAAEQKTRKTTVVAVAQAGSLNSGSQVKRESKTRDAVRAKVLKGRPDSARADHSSLECRLDAVSTALRFDKAMWIRLEVALHLTPSRQGTAHDGEKLLHVLELTADSLQCYSELRAYVADYVTSKPSPMAKAAPRDIPPQVVHFMVRNDVNCYRTPDTNTEFMSAWLLELFEGLEKKSRDFVARLESWLADIAGEMAKINGLSKHMDRLRRKLTDMGMRERLAQLQADGPRGGRKKS